MLLIIPKSESLLIPPHLYFHTFNQINYFPHGNHLPSPTPDLHLVAAHASGNDITVHTLLHLQTWLLPLPQSGPYVLLILPPQQLPNPPRTLFYPGLCLHCLSCFFTVLPVSRLFRPPQPSGVCLEGHTGACRAVTSGGSSGREACPSLIARRFSSAFYK